MRDTLRCVALAALWDCLLRPKLDEMVQRSSERASGPMSPTGSFATIRPTAGFRPADRGICLCVSQALASERDLERKELVALLDMYEAVINEILRVEDVALLPFMYRLLDRRAAIAEAIGQLGARPEDTWRLASGSPQG